MRKLAIVVALSSTAIASPAIARDGAWYIGADFGAMIVEDIEFEFGRAGPIPTGEGELEIDLDPGFDGAAFVVLRPRYTGDAAALLVDRRHLHALDNLSAALPRALR